MTKPIQILFFLLAFAITALAQTPPPQLKYSRIVGVREEVVASEDLRNVVAAAISTWPIDGVAAPNEKEYSYAFVNPGQFTSYSEVDLVKFEFNTIKDFIEGNGIFSKHKDNSAKIILANVYGFEHEHAIAVMAQAARSGLYASIIATDGPISGEKKNVTDPSKYEEGEKYTNKISPEDLDNSGQGEELRKLLDKSVGYEFRSPTFNPKQEGEELIKKGDRYITMSAFYRNITIGPIQHLKEKVMIVLKEPSKGLQFKADGKVDGSNIEAIYIISGNGNATPRMHNNLSRFFMSANAASRKLAEFTIEHTRAILETFTRVGKSARIDKIEFDYVLRLKSESGDEKVERAYTDGRNEINDRLAVFLSTGGQSFGPRPATRSRLKYQDFAILNAAAKGQVHEVILNHFVFTNREFVNALYDAWLEAKKQGHPFKIRGVLDGKFVGMRSYGLAAALKGLVAENPFGKEMPALDSELANHVDIVVNIERVRGAKNIAPDGPPSTNILQHGKMTIAIMEVKMKSGETQKFAILADGSMNLSGNEANLEVQDMMVVLLSKLNSYLEFVMKAVNSLIDRTLGKTQDGRPRGYRLEEYLSIQAAARLLGLDVEQVDPALVKELSGVFEKLPAKSEKQRKEEIQKVKAKLLDFHRSKESELIASLQVSNDVLGKTLDKIADFIMIYSSLNREEQGQISTFSSQERLDVIVGLTEDPISAKRAISRILKRNGLPYDVLEQRAYQIYQQLDLESLFKAKGIPEPKFPIYKNRNLPILDLSNDNVKKMLSAVETKDYQTAARELVKMAKMETADQSFKIDITDETGVLFRLTKINPILERIAKLENRGKSTFKPTVAALEKQLWSENYELLLLMRGYDRNAGQIVYYMLVQKGYSGKELRDLSNDLLGEFGIKPLTGPVGETPTETKATPASKNICYSLF